jgi:hypothetical protein
MPIILALRKLMQEDHKFEASLDNIECSIQPELYSNTVSKKLWLVM